MLQRFTVFFLFMALVIFQGLGAQEANDWFMNKPIKEIQFEGLKTVSRSELEGITKNYLWKPFTEELNRELLSRLYSLDFFDGLIDQEIKKLDSDGLFSLVVFKVKEKPTVQEIVIEQNERVGTSDILNVVASKKGQIFKETLFKSDERKIKDLLLEKGFQNSNVTSSIKKDEQTNTLTLVFSISEGDQTIIKTINFKGNLFASTNTLKGLLKSKESGIFESGAFREMNLREDQLLLLSYYGNRGYVDAKVVDIERTEKKDATDKRNYLELTYVIDEGISYIYEKMEFQGNTIYSSDELLTHVRQVPGKPVNKAKLSADIQKIKDLYYENGYIFTSIEPQEKRNGNQLSIVLIFKEQPRAHVENILIKGNTKTKDKVILRELPLVPGDVFSKSKVIEGLMNLRNLQYFTGSPQVETPTGSADGLMDLVLTVEEAQTAEIMFGLSFSGATDFPVMANLKWQDKNFLGNGNVFGLELNASPVEQSLSVNFSESWFLDRPISVGGSFLFGHYVKSNIQQDILFPTYNGDVDIPDPYDNNTYVFSRDTLYNATNYKAGDIFPDIATDALIAQYSLLTQYDYDLKNGKLIVGQNTMTYDSIMFSLSLYGGIKIPNPFGRLTYQIGGKTNPQLVIYDDKLYRPASKSLRENLNQWKFDNSIWNQVGFDTRDLIIFPNYGIYLADTYTITGGILGGQTHYTRNDLRFEAYYKVLDINMTELWENLTNSNTGSTEPVFFKTVMTFRSTLSQLFDPIGNAGLQVLQPKDELFVDGSRNGRGWSQQRYGKVVWTSAFEARVPVIDQFLAWETFVDASILIPTASNEKWLDTIPLKQYKFGMGTGLRIINPSFPIGLYLAKPFTIQENGWQWEKGEGLLGQDVDMKLVISIGFNM